MISAGNTSDGHQKWFVWENSPFATAPLGVVYEDCRERAQAAADIAFMGLSVKVWPSPQESES